MTTKTKRSLGHLLIGSAVVVILGSIGWVFATAITDVYEIALVYSCLIMLGSYGFAAGFVFLVKYLLVELS